MSLGFGSKSDPVTSLCAAPRGHLLRKQGFSFICIIQVLKFPALVRLWELKKTFSQPTVSRAFLAACQRYETSEGRILTQGLDNCSAKLSRLCLKEVLVLFSSGHTIHRNYASHW